MPKIHLRSVLAQYVQTGKQLRKFVKSRASRFSAADFCSPIFNTRQSVAERFWTA